MSPSPCAAHTLLSPQTASPSALLVAQFVQMSSLPACWLCSPGAPFQEGALTARWDCVCSAGPLEPFPAQLAAGVSTETPRTLCSVDSTDHNGSVWAGLLLLQEVWSTPQLHSTAFGMTLGPAGRTGPQCVCWNKIRETDPSKQRWELGLHWELRG